MSSIEKKTQVVDDESGGNFLNEDVSTPKKQKLNADGGSSSDVTTETLTDTINVNNKDDSIKICKHVLEKKKRRCKFNALRNLDYCVAHLAFNDQTDNADKRVICPLDPKHSVYEKNLQKHLKKCNAKEKCLGKYDIKNINVSEKSERSSVNQETYHPNETEKPSLEFTTYKELGDAQLTHIIELLQSFDKKFNLFNLKYNKLTDEFLESVSEEKQDKNNKHLDQISSIVSHVEVLLQNANDNDIKDQSTCLVELGAGRGKLSYWYEQSRSDKVEKNNEYIKKKLNILLVERGSQRFKFDYHFKKESADFERIRIDLKDFWLNEVDLIKKSEKYLLYGKHLCGVATDYALRCLKYSLEELSNTNEELKFSGLVLAVCCHNQCVWESFCGKKFFEEELKIDSKMFYILRSITSWYVTCAENNLQTEEELVHGISKQKLGRICKNLFDFARLRYLTESIHLPSNYKMRAELFYYVEKDVTLENTMIYAHLEKA